MSFLILVRHGQSIWNLERKFPGWVDIDLTEDGKLEAEKAGFLIKKENIKINYFYSSLQLRANHTLKIIQKVLNHEKHFSRAQKIQYKSGKNSQVHDFPSEYERMGRYQSSVYRSTRQSSPGAKCLGRERVDP